MIFTTLSRTALVLSLGFLPVACAQQSQPPASSGMSGMPGMGGTSGAGGMNGMPGMKMDGTDMQAMMGHCAQMRSDMSQGKPMAPDMQAMMAQCGQMNHAMPMGGMPAGGPAPASTLSR